MQSVSPEAEALGYMQFMSLKAGCLGDMGFIFPEARHLGEIWDSGVSEWEV